MEKRYAIIAQLESDVEKNSVNLIEAMELNGD